MRGDLSVRINDSSIDRHVTRHVRGLRFRKTAPGGHASAQMQLTLPRDMFTDLGPADRLYIYDARTAETMWEGYTENPGATDGPTGQSWELSAKGGLVLAGDESRALQYIDRDLNLWEQYRGVGAAPSATAAVSDDPTGVATTQGLLIQFNPGQPVGTGAVAQIGYEGLRTSDMEFGAARQIGKSGKTDTGYRTDMSYSNPSPASGFFNIFSFTQMQTTEVTDTRYVGDASSVPAAMKAVAYRLRRAGVATNVADDNTWTWLRDVAVLGRRMDRSGTLLTGSAGMVTTEYVLAHWVVEDLLGRLLTFCNPNLSRIDTTTFQIDQLAYHDGATAAKVLDDLALYEPGHLWEILESDADGRHRLKYRALPTEPRYEISVKDGYTAPGGEADLCNRIAVYWTDERGQKRSIPVTSTVPKLGTRVRDAASVTLPEGRGSEATAQRVGAQVLAGKASPPKAARATLRRPIVDHLTGNEVMPWEIETGYVVRVRETGDDLLLSEMEYSDEDVAALLTLGTPVRSVEQMLAGL